MFARRSLQRLLDELAHQIPIDGRRKFVHELNRNSPSALGFEWELALLYALNKVGAAEYEATGQTSTRRADITFKEHNGPIRFRADVATVSDEGLEDENPIMPFAQELSRLRRKHDLKGMLNYDVRGEAAGPRYGDRKMRLKLPRAAKITEILRRHVEPELKRIQSESLTEATITVQEPGIDFTITYSEKQHYGGGRYPSFTAAYSRTRNPVYTSLKAKARQLKGVAEDFPLGIFLCDGGCQLLGNTQRYVANFSVTDVIGEFLRQNSSITFVAVLVFPPTRSEIFSGLIKERRITGQLYVNPRVVNLQPPNNLLELINRGLAHLPEPAATPRDALRSLRRDLAKNTGYFDTITHGGSLMSESVKISSRRVQELLAGKLTAQKLFEDFDRPDRKFDNPFLSALRRGLTMKTITLIKNNDLDDDLLEFWFGPPDPAVGKLSIKEPSDR